MTDRVFNFKQYMVYEIRMLHSAKMYIIFSLELARTIHNPVLTYYGMFCGSKCLGCIYVQRESKSSDFKGVSGA